MKFSDGVGVILRLMVGLTLYLGLSQASLADDEVVKIGMMVPLTGLEQVEGLAYKKAFDLAIKQVNAQGGINGKKILGVLADTKSTPMAALEAYDQLISKDGAVVIVGPIKSAQIVAMVPKMQKAGVPTIIGGTNPRLTDEGQWFFRVRPDDSIVAEAMVSFIKRSTKFTKVGILHDVGAFGAGGANLVEKSTKKLGLQMVKRQGFNMGETEFTGYLKGLKDAGAEVVVVYASRLEDQGQIEKDYAKLGRPFQYLGSASSQSKIAIDIAKEAAEGIYAVVDFVFGQTEADRKYLADFKAEYKEMPDPLATYPYDGVKILVNAMRAVGFDKAKIRAHIMSLKDEYGVQGRYHFDSHGNGIHAVNVVRVEKGKPQLIEVVDVESESK